MKILVVEDNQAVAQTLQLLLTGYDYTVELASDGQAGLAMAEATQYDLMLLDLMLPKLDGVSLCQRLRAQGIDCPIVLITGQDGSHQRAIALQAGADDYLVKPFHAEELMDQIQRLLRGENLPQDPDLATQSPPWQEPLQPSDAAIAAVQTRDRYDLSPSDEMQAIRAELRRTQQQLQATQAELQQTQQALALAEQTIAQKPPSRQAMRDDLERRVAELQQRELFLSSIYDGAAQAIFVVDRMDHEFRYVSFNRLAEQYSGLSAQAVQQKTPEEVFGATIGAAFRQRYAHCVQVGHSISYEEQIAFEDRVIWTLTTLSPLRNDQGEIYRIVGTCIDISDHKQAELEIRKFAALADSSSDFIGMCDMNFIPFYINPAGKQLLGLENLEQYQHVPVREFFFPEDQDFILNEFFPRILQDGQAEVEIRFRHFQTGKALWMIYHVIAIQDDQGQPIALATISRNITERKNAEELLKFSQAMFEALVTNMPGMVYRYVPKTADRPDHFTFISHHSYELLELSPDRLTQDFNAFVSLIHPEDLPSFLASVTYCVEHFLPWRWEGRIITPSGRVKWLQGTSQAQKVLDGEAWDGLLLDISDRKRIEVELRQSEQKLRAIFDSTFEFMGLMTPSGILVDANRASLEIVAANLEDVIKKPFWETPWWTEFPQQQQQLREAIARAAQGEFVRLETKHRWADGRIAYVDFSLKPILDETGTVIMLVPEGRDITDRKLAEQRVQEQAALLDITSDAIFVRDLDNRIVYWNRGAERLYGWMASEAIGQLAHELLQHPQSAIEQVLQRLSDGGVWQGEITTATKTGQRVIVEASWTMIRDESGQPQSILSVDTDVTEKKQLEAQFYRAQRLESLGTLASGIAHDLNNVLTPVLAISQLLRLKQPNLDARSRQMLQVLEESAKRGAEMIKQILTFTRGTEGDRSPVQVASVLQEVINIVRQTFPKSIVLRQRIPKQAPWFVCADSTYLHQVVMNLCVNARDAMPNGGILSVSIEPCVVDQAFTQVNLEARMGEYVVITVADTGTGIPSEVREHIFEPFFTTKAQGQGTGLGLASVLGIVKSYGGFVQVLSEMGQGTQMKVYLPLLKEHLSRASAAQESLEGHGESVLVVDDDVAVQLSLQSLLEGHHYKVRSSQDGSQAIDLYTQHQDEIQVVILDIMMPGMGGLTLIQKLKMINPTLKIIAMSGLLSNRDSALAAGATVFVAKPFMPDTLLGHLQGLLSSGAYGCFN